MEGGAMRRSQSKEAIELWYECLKRARAQKLRINHLYYRKWEQWERLGFESWWLETGRDLFIENRVVLAVDADPEMNSVLVAVPRGIPPTEAAHQLRTLMLEFQRDVHKARKFTNRFKFTAGAEIKVDSVRAYLSAYDVLKKLEARSKGTAVSSTELLHALRIFYLSGTDRTKGEKAPIEPMPSALANGMTVNPVTGKRVAVHATDNSGALRAVRRYVLCAQRLIQNAADGAWPGQYQ
jgi:hypothetical protein